MSQTSVDGAVRGFTYALYLLAICWLAVRTHRLVLLGQDEAKPPTFAQARNSISRYLGSIVVGWLGYVLAVLALMTIAANVFLARYVPAGTPAAVTPPDPDTQRLLDLLIFGVSLPVLYYVARLMLVLHGIALGEKFDLGVAWRRSRGNGWRLAAATLLLPRLFDYALDLLGDFATHIAVIGVVVVLTAIVASLEVIALSLSYRELAAKPAPPPTDPRA